MDDSSEAGNIKEKWYYVIIQDPATATEQYVGFSDSQSTEKFIPLFESKQEATQCFALMPKDLFNGQYAVQAVIKEDILDVANQNGHTLYLLDEKGTILDTIN